MGMSKRTVMLSKHAGYADTTKSGAMQRCQSESHELILLLESDPPPLLLPIPPSPPCANYISIASSRHLTSSLKLSQAAASAFCPSQTWLLGSVAMSLSTAMMSGKLAFSWRGPGPLYEPDPLFTLPQGRGCQHGQTVQHQNACDESATECQHSAGRRLTPGSTGHPYSRIQSTKKEHN